MKLAVENLDSKIKILYGLYSKRDYQGEELIKFSSRSSPNHNEKRRLKERRSKVRKEIGAINRKIESVKKDISSNLEKILRDYSGETKNLKILIQKERELNRVVREGEELANAVRGSLSSLDQSRRKKHFNYDFFICHASEDKADVARPLSKALLHIGYRVWFDEFTLRVGDSLFASINEGLNSSAYGIVIFSDNFFKKQWPQSELAALYNKSIDTKKVILPILHHLSVDELKQHNLMIADLVHISTSNHTISEIAKELDELFKI